MLKQLDQSTKTGVNLHATFCLAFAGFLRAGEFTYIVRDKESHSFNL